ncbi:MAG: hypothetical protein V3U74_05640 [Thermodesulfobacteriota bacterium]
MCKSRKNLKSRAMFIGWIVPSLSALAVMTVVTYLGRSYIGTPFIPELLYESIQYSPFFEPLFEGTGEASAQMAALLSALIYSIAGLISGAGYIALWRAINYRLPKTLAVLYSILLWAVFITACFPVLGLGFLGKYLTGFPPALLVALLIGFVVYGGVLGMAFGYFYRNFTPSPKETG